jgi:hypothetical protein
MSMEFIFLPRVDQILLDDYLESFPMQEARARDSNI